MSFAAPLMWLGLLALLPLIALYFLKVRPTRKPATAWFLWSKVFEERRARTLFERFRDLFSLLLLVIVFLAAVAAAARPFWVGDSRKDLLLLIDNSASMNAVENGSTRLDLAKQAANEIVQALDGNQKCSVAAMAAEVVFYSNLTDNPRELLNAIERIPATSLPSSPQSLAAFIRDVPPTTTNEAKIEESVPPISTPAVRRLLISDGCVGAVSETEGLEWIRIGAEGEGNLGIVACDMQRLPLANWPVGVYLQITSSFKENITVDLGVYHETDERLKKLIPLQIKPGLNSAEVFRIEDAPEGRWIFRLEQADRLMQDNEAYAYLPALVPVDVGVAGDDRFFYDQSVQAFSSGERWLRLVPILEAAVVIGQGNLASADVSDTAAMLIFNPTGESAYWSELQDEFAVGLAVVPDEDHPLVKHWDAGSLAWLGAKRLKMPPGAEVLVSADDGTPLMYRVSDRGRSVVVVNLNPAEADFFLSPWFPVLVYSVATHLSGQGEPKPTALAVGRQLREFFVDNGRDMLESVPAKIRHMICLSDGHTTNEDHDSLTQAMVDSGITVSTVALGDADRGLMARIAEIGRGRYYETNDPNAVPQIFASETIQASRSAIKEDLYGVVQTGFHSALAGFHDTDLPFVLGYVLTQAKPTTQVLMVSEAGDPLLAVGRFGLGTGIAWSSDLSEKWGGEWLAWGDCGKFWSQVLRSLIRPRNSDGMFVTGQAVGDQWNLTILKRDLNGVPESKVNWELAIIDPSGQIETSEVRETGLGQYQASIPIAARPSFSVRLRDPDSDQIQVVHYDQAWPAEYRLARDLPACLNGVAGMEVESVRENLVPQTSRVSVAHYFYFASLGFFLLGNLIRRL